MFNYCGRRMLMRTSSFISSCHSCDIIVAVMSSHIVFVSSSIVVVDFRQVYVIRFDTASSIIILHTSGVSSEL